MARNRLKYAAILLLCTVVVGTATALVGSGVTVLEGRAQHVTDEVPQDGQFTLLLPMQASDFEDLQTAYAVELEQHFSFEIPGTDGLTVRVFPVREHIDKLTLCEGRAPMDENEVVLEQLYADAVGASVGDTVTPGDRELTVVGIGCLPDYVTPVAEITDVSVDPTLFTFVVVSADTYEAWQKESGREQTYTYAFLRTAGTDMDAFRNAVMHLDLDYVTYAATHETFAAYVQELLLSYDVDLSDAAAAENVLSAMADRAVTFLEACDNPRIGEETTYAKLYRDVGMAAGAFLMVLLSWVFAITLRQQVTSEAGMIGSLAALGVGRQTLLWYYLLPSALTALLGGGIGLAVAYSPLCMNMALDAFHVTYSFPSYAYACPWYLWLYAMLMPSAVTIIVNGCSLAGLFRQSVLSVMRTTEVGKPHTLRCRRRLCASNRIRLRIFMRNLPGFAILFLGMLLAGALLFLGGNSRIIADNAAAACADIPYEYRYTLRYPLQDVGDNRGERLLCADFTYLVYGEKISVPVLGVSKNSQYYALPVMNDDTVALGASFAAKSGLHVGDSVCLQRNYDDKEYQFTVGAILAAGPDMSVYMNAAALCALLGEPAQSYNTIIASEPLAVCPACISSTARRTSVESGVAAIEKNMVPFIRLSVIASVLLLVIFVYLVTVTMMTRQVRTVSLYRIFGYTDPEVTALFFAGIGRGIFLCAAVALPLAKRLADLLCPWLYAEMAVAMDFTLPPRTALLIAAGTYILLTAVWLGVRQYGRKMPFSDLLKDENIAF